MTIILSVLAKNGRAKILKILGEYPNRDFSINELARESKIPVMTCWRAAREFDSLGVVEIRSIGNVSAIRLKQESDAAKSALSIIEMDRLDPYREAALEFGKKMSYILGILSCILFGSVLKGTHKPGSDVDVAVVYDVKKIEKESLDLKIAKGVAEVEEKYRIHIVALPIEKRETAKPGVKRILSGGEDIGQYGDEGGRNLA
ncbi:MAG: nucleotidyltransferase domain-containing protein [Candidatus Thermoplasmatota archaeon]|nr:nucleotidyltransferase domain-containing protein [Candidatus Thermoplasmatota archaeon]